jgi:putative NIF3 family GTP cyclohydrolase 1 type 2
MSAIPLADIVNLFTKYFEIDQLKVDPSMSHFVPKVYEKDRKVLSSLFEVEFLNRFNGLLLIGGETVNTIFTASFPHDEILQKFISQSEKGDLLFLHHPIPLECGDPKGKSGRGFLPLNLDLVKGIKSKQLSVFSCHAPLDTHHTVSTNRAIAESIGGKIEREFLPFGNGYAGLIVSIPDISSHELSEKLQSIFDIPYVETAGNKKDHVTTVGIVAGGGDEKKYSETALELGAQAYITGEIFSHQQSDWAVKNTLEIKKYIQSSPLCFFGVSHAASEFLVMKSQLPRFIKKHFSVSTVPLPQDIWWK